MLPANFERTLRALVRRAPFRPFTVELVSGDRIVVDHPEALVYRAGVAVYISPEGYPAVFDHEGVSQIIGQKSRHKPNGKRRRGERGS
jgi:hypothetical protein